MMAVRILFVILSVLIDCSTNLVYASGDSPMRLLEGGSLHASTYQGAPQLPILKKIPSRIRGRVVDGQGRALSNCTVIISGSTVTPRKEVVYHVPVKEGEYDIEVPDGVYSIQAEFRVAYREHLYTLNLQPSDGEHIYTSYNSRQGLIKDFIWKMTGLNSYYEGDANSDDESPNFTHHHGAAIEIDKESPIYGNDVIEFVLNPVGPLIDGQEGKSIVYKRTQATRAAYTEFILDIPIGNYEIMAQVRRPNGEHIPLMLRSWIRGLTSPGNPSNTQLIEFPPAQNGPGIQYVTVDYR